MDKFVVLDIESPNTYFNSVSAIGIIIVENNKITDKIYSLINPEDEFEEDIIELTVITQEMVEDKPTFYEFWPEREYLLVTNTIIGHNITYDLTVISNSLENYNINVPDFKYICTYKLSYNLLKLEAYSLEYIMNQLNYDYDAHNALADAEAAYYLYKHLDNIQKITPINQKIFCNKDKNSSINEKLYPNINELYGMILEFRYKEKITENQINLFKEWINKNKEYSDIKEIKNIIIRLNSIITKNKLNNEDKINISTIVTSVSKSKKYSKEELNLQVLIGIIKMYKCSKENNTDEKEFIKKWLTYYTLPKSINASILLKSLN